MVDIAGTKQKLQRMVKVAEETYKKLNELIEEIEQVQSDLSTTSDQVDHIERELTEQRVLIEAIAKEQELDIETVLEDIEYPERVQENSAEVNADEELAGMATSRPSATENQE